MRWPGLLTAEGPGLLLQFDQDVAVADVGLDDRDAGVGHRAVQAEVAHGRDDQSPAERVAFEEVAREEDHEVVAVAHVALGVDRDQSVGVAVEGETQVGVQFEHVRDEVFDVGRAAVLVDVATVRLVVDRRDARAGRLEDLVRDVTGRAVRAVEHDVE